ncbi:5-dehydro-4-deoxyglucarate dehydratase [Alicyclobacillus sp.]|uniref:5-dehydro-4-deoxyglucarate dehydratase n=1 Tax=Alicyclobacillus sp. TaxID=61169 RepID=UPI0025BFD664|nr:5-dehydro-4-deoxyglucarate dehydratase [Alicyclobacillus sp.]MCL6517053.1 5-dehydro-4-deoxyglucarate dehydratase [Alicyclobacillus sp.]
MTEQRRAFPQGIHGFPVAPFDAEGRLDLEALAANVAFLVENRLKSIFVACGSGEFHALSREEYRAMLETAVSVASGRVPVYAGVGGNLSNALELAAIAQQAGVDGCLILPPYLVQAEQPGLVRYFRTIAESTELSAIIYQRDNAIFTLETVRTLAEVPQIIGFKDGYGNMELNIEFTQELGGRFEWFNGMPFAEVTMPLYYAIGYRSYSSALSNYLPHISRLFYHALTTGNQELLNELYREVILPIHRIRRQRKGYAVALIKAGMEIVGLPVNRSVRAPLTPVEEEHHRALARIIEHAMTQYPPDGIRV